MQALLQSNARVDAANSDKCDPARAHWSRFHGCEGLWVGVWRWLPKMVRFGADVPVWLGLKAIEVMTRGTSACRCRSESRVGFARE